MSEGSTEEIISARSGMYAALGDAREVPVPKLTTLAHESIREPETRQTNYLGSARKIGNIVCQILVPGYTTTRWIVKDAKKTKGLERLIKGVRWAAMDTAKAMTLGYFIS